MCKIAFAYLVKCVDGSFYAGWTYNPAVRLTAHNNGSGAKYTRAHRPVTLVYLERCEDKRTAMQREAQLKHMTHAQKVILIEEYKQRLTVGH